MNKMKRNLLFGAAFFFVAWAATSCEALSDCKTCKQVYYLKGTSTVDHEGSDVEYCGAELITIEATGTVTIGDFDAKYECR
jgi:hypothetical protein